MTLALVLAACVASGCSGSPDPAQSTPAFPTEEKAFAAAEETYRAYVDALNQVDLSDPDTFEDVFAWTTGELNASDRRGLSEYHANEVTVHGESVPILIQPSLVDTDAPRVELSVCLDVAAVEVTGSSGESLVDPERTDVQSLTISLTGSPRSSTKLLVDSIGPRDGAPSCE
jgi:hypothetical protein